MQYNRETLLYELDLKRDDMPLLATLAGNDLISRNLLKDFHESLGNPNRKFYNIANFIRKSNHSLRGDFSKLAEHIMPRVDKQKAIQLISNSFDQYNLSKINNIQMSNDSILQHSKQIHIVYKILSGLHITLKTGCYG